MIFIVTVFVFFFEKARLFSEEYLTPVCNANFGLGLFAGQVPFLLLSLAVLGGIVYKCLKSKQFSERILFSILVAGGSANVFERIRFGCVTDYIEVPFIGSMVNAADIAITVTVFFLLVKMFSPKTS